MLHTALRAPRGAAPHADEVHGCSMRCSPSPSACATPRTAACATSSTSASVAPTSGRRWPCRRWTRLPHATSRVHFVSNVDGHDIAPVLRRLKPESTLFVVASKTFTTQETMANAEVARQWFVDQGGRDVARHFVAVTTNLAAAAAFGITTTFGFWDWVGGRYSMWSAIGLPIAIAIGEANFRALLAGAHAMDRHFAEAPLESNLPVQLGLLDVWYRNFHRFTSRSVAPYHQGLRRLPAYLQQLEMESNGKGVDLDGQSLPYGTSPVVWGEPGTNGQHAFFQMLHQGTDVIPVEFIAVREPSHAQAALHRKALANCLAQSQALMHGQDCAAGARRQGAHRVGHLAGRHAGAAPHLPRQPAEHDAGARCADAAQPGCVDRPVRAQGVHQWRRVGDQQLRSMGGRAGQGAVQRIAAAVRHWGFPRFGRIDGRPADTPARLTGGPRGPQRCSNPTAGF